jgi:hypothetical protein
MNSHCPQRPVHHLFARSLRDQIGFRSAFILCRNGIAATAAEAGRQLRSVTMVAPTSRPISTRAVD